jgi:hypothetical protein
MRACGTVDCVHANIKGQQAIADSTAMEDLGQRPGRAAR